jgi:hypothetical protein
MKYGGTRAKWAGYAGLALASLFSLTCQESLPTYVFPANIMSLGVGTIEQLSNRVSPPGHQLVHMVLIGKNTFDEVYLDSVNIKGAVRIWWKRKPRRFRTIYLSEQNFTDPTLIKSGKMMLLPGQQFGLDIYWNLTSDDSLYLPSEMIFDFLRRDRQCDWSVACSDPEMFVVEASLSVYDRIGYVAAPAREFKFIGTLCICNGGPYCPGPPGCGP